MKQYVLLEEPITSSTCLIALVLELWNCANEEMILDVIKCNDSKGQVAPRHLINEKVNCASLYQLQYYVGSTKTIQLIKYLSKNNPFSSISDR
ncbi:hypothetical protein Q9L58_010414, partial [Maublancomyces gigas]